MGMKHKKSLCPVAFMEKSGDMVVTADSYSGGKGFLEGMPRRGQ